MSTEFGKETSYYTFPSTSITKHRLWQYPFSTQTFALHPLLSSCCCDTHNADSSLHCCTRSHATRAPRYQPVPPICISLHIIRQYFRALFCPAAEQPAHFLHQFKDMFILGGAQKLQTMREPQVQPQLLQFNIGLFKMFVFLFY